MKVKNLLILFLSFLPLLASADPVEVNGIYYNLSSEGGVYTAEVAKRPEGWYSGDIQIPMYVTYNEEQYKVTKIGFSAFLSSSMTSIQIPNSVTSIDRMAFQSCSNLSSIEIPNSVRSIGTYAFFCSGLKSVTLPNRLLSIPKYAFYGCSKLETIVFPSSVKNISTNAFGDCSALKDVYCYANKMNTVENNAFTTSNIAKATLHIPLGSMEYYKNTAPWNQFKNIFEPCAMPTISYADHKLSFECETEGVEFVYEITDEDIKSGTANEVELTVTYNVSVYAKKALFDNSEAATATLCWVDQEPVIHTDISEAVEFTAAPVLIQSYGGIVTVQGAADGTPVSIYTTAGTQAGSTVSQHSMARINTNMQPGTIAIIKIGDKSVKTVVK